MKVKVVPGSARVRFVLTYANGKAVSLDFGSHDAYIAGKKWRVACFGNDRAGAYAEVEFDDVSVICDRLLETIAFELSEAISGALQGGRKAAKPKPEPAPKAAKPSPKPKPAKAAYTGGIDL